MSRRAIAVACITALVCCLSAYGASAESGEQAGSTVLAAHEGTQVSVQDFRRYVQAVIPDNRRNVVLSKPENIRKIVVQLYTLRRLAARANDQDWVSDDATQWQLTLRENRFLGTEYLKRAVSERVDDLDWENSAREEYQARPEEYQRPEQVRVAHVLINTDERSEKQARKLAREVKSKAQSGGDFLELAKEYSDGPSAERGGKLGWIARGDTVPPFEKAAFALKSDGAISPVVKTKKGFHVVKRLEHRQAGQKPFAAVRDQIVERLKRERRQSIRNDVLNQVRGNVDAVINNQALRELTAHYEPQGQAPNEPNS